MSRVLVCGTGCCLMDRIYANVDFSSPEFARYRSLVRGDGGLEPGHLTLEGDLERFSGRRFSDLLPEITSGAAPDAENIGGPAIVALIHAAQMCGNDAAVRFYGCHGGDTLGNALRSRLERTPVDLTHYTVFPSEETSVTTVLSDPAADGGHGERTFVNTVGAAASYGPENVDSSFYEGDICVFGGTALVPRIHEGLSEMMAEARRRGAITFVCTVYDFINERRAPGKPWPLGGTQEAYSLTDLLVADKEEALRLSGTDNIRDAIDFFKGKGTGAVVVTSGADPVWLWSGGGRLQAAPLRTIPVSEALGRAWKQPSRRGDSTGCGDNFAGGIIASMASGLAKGEDAPDLVEACSLGVVSGGFAGLHYGGTWMENEPGEKRRLLQPYYEQYLLQRPD